MSDNTILREKITEALLPFAEERYKRSQYSVAEEMADATIAAIQDGKAFAWIHRNPESGNSPLLSFTPPDSSELSNEGGTSEPLFTYSPDASARIAELETDRDTYKQGMAKVIIERDALRKDADNLRRMLCSTYSGGTAYTDDGELQDNRVLPFIDFKRDTPEQIEKSIVTRGLAEFAAQTEAGGKK